MHSYLRILVALFVAIGLYSQANSQLTMTGVGGGGFGAGGFSPSCSESSNFIARTTGLNDTQKTRYDTLICGLVTDAVFSKLDALYVFASPDSTTAKLNLVSLSFSPLTEAGTVTFTADQGYASNGTTGYLDTGFNPTTAAGNYMQDSASYGACNTTNNAGYDSGALIGGGISYNSRLFIAQNSAVLFLAVNANANATPAATTQQGNWIATRTASNLTTLYRNGSSFATTTNVSGGINNSNIYILATNDGPAAFFLNSNDKLSYAFIGGGFTGTDATNLTSRIHTFMSSLTVPINVCG